MQTNEIRLGLLSALLGGALVAGIGALAVNHRSASANSDAFRPPAQTIVVAAPQVQVPGYTGPLYDGQGKIVAVGGEAKASPFVATPNPITHNRSTGKSVAIVAGSAGAGAAIGALAGGGKGAGIGAASGGAAGFIFDRMTAHKKQ